MSENSMLRQRKTSHIAGANAEYVDALYERFLANPDAVSADWKSYFSNLPSINESTLNDTSHKTVQEYYLLKAKNSTRVEKLLAASTVSTEYERKQVKVVQLIAGYRNRGHQAARLDPLGIMHRDDVPDLQLHHYGLSDADLDLIFQTGTLFLGKPEATLAEILECLNQTYCKNVGVEYMHIVDTEERRWIQEYMETERSHPEYSKEEKLNIYDRIVAADGLESYLAGRYPGTKRFGLEGGESLIAILDECIQRLGSQGAKEIVIGMAHRGRLNVLVNILGKKPEELFDEFDGNQIMAYGAGDVKYHQGFSSNMITAGGETHIALASNPSHLEIVSPVVEGSVRARQDRRKDENHDMVVPIIVHGDAAFAGQGVVMETFQMSQTRGFHTGGTIHVIVNNQVGFTTSKREDARSTEYCTDVAKMVQAPIIHVNADNPEAVLFVTQLAVDYRTRFKKDIVIDMICYRRRGHNEADEPSGTQPIMYKHIKQHRSVLDLYGDQLMAEGVLTVDAVSEKKEAYRNNLTSEDNVVRAFVKEPNKSMFVDWSKYVGHDYDEHSDTSFDHKRLTELSEALLTYPDDLVVQRQVSKVLETRQQMASGLVPVNWGFAENAAYASLLDEGFTVRLTGQDCGRGTFSHRHAVLHDQTSGRAYIPLAHLTEEDDFWIYDSLLSEEAVLAFEYGYSTTTPSALSVWEAQFGDFANGAQVVIDQFIAAGEAKWNRVCGLTMLLPHGYEGQGPEHSSARLERFLQLCAQKNMEVCAPTTPAQIFHLLRRQMKRMMRKPLVIMSPKSLLRHPKAISLLQELSDGTFETVIDDPQVVEEQRHESISRIVLCSGKVYYDIKAEQEDECAENVTVIRLEQMYPPPVDTLMKVLAKYQHATSLVWCQEEPRNQGAYYRMKFELGDDLTMMNNKWKMTYAGRPAAASPAVGYAFLHAREQKQLVRDALGLAAVK